MEVRIRLQKAGKSAKKNYNYRIVAMPRAKSRQSNHLEILGYYDPAKRPATLSFDQAKVDKWVSRGATLSDTVKALVKKNSKATRA